MPYDPTVASISNRISALGNTPAPIHFTLCIQKDAQYDTYNYFRDYYKELQTVCANVDNILGTEREVQREQQQFRKSAPSL